MLALSGRLNDEGIVSPSGASRWTRAVIHRLLRNPGYKGEAYNYCWGTTKERGRKVMVERPRDEWIRLPDGVIPL